MEKPSSMFAIRTSKIPAYTNYQCINILRYNIICADRPLHINVIRSEALTVAELKQCTGLMRKKFRVGANPEAILSLLDSNKDGFVSRSEFNTAKKKMNEKKSGQFSGTTVDVTDRHGVTQTLPIEKVWELMEQGESDHSAPLDKEQVDDNVVSSSNLTEIAQQNPDMAKFIAIGYWLQDRLLELGIEQADGDISQLRTLPIGGTLYRGSEKLSPGNIVSKRKFHIWVEMSVKKSRPLSSIQESTFLFKDDGEKERDNKDKNRNNNKNNNEIMTISFIELHVEMNPDLFKRPFLSLHEGWLLDRDGNRRLKLNVPKEHQASDQGTKITKIQIDDNSELLMTKVFFVAGTIFLTGIVTILVFQWNRRLRFKNDG